MAVANQEIYDALHALIQASSRVHEVITADFPEVRNKIREYVSEGEYHRDPLAALFDAIDAATAIADRMVSMEA